MAHLLLNSGGMINPTFVFPATAQPGATLNFWQQIANDEALRDLHPLEKLLAGCEIIAAVDDLDLLAA